jgi:flavorubredoxin
VAKFLIVYASRGGQTKNIAQLIGEGIRIAGHEARIVEAAGVNSEADLAGYDGYVFGSATYHGDMIGGMKTMLFVAEKAGLAGKIGGAFGAYGWSGEAVTRIFDTMRHVFQMDMVSGPLMLKSAALEGGTKMAQDYGRQLAAKAG